MNHTVYRARAPLRLGLAGGGTDVSPYSDQFGGLILNVTIDKFVHATLKPMSNGTLEISSLDNGSSWTGIAPASIDFLSPGIDLHIGVYNRIVREFNSGKPMPVALTTQSDAPPGSGLGSSSAMVVAIIKVFAEYLDLPFGEYDIANLAYQIEREELGLAGGKQDQYAAAFGGLNYMEFKGSSVIVNPLNIKRDISRELESSILLFYTGQSRESAKIIEQQSKNVTKGVENAMRALHGVKHEASRMKDALIRGDFDTFIDSMRVGWEQKKMMADSITNAHIDEIYAAAIAAGASAGRVSGAGGGGFMIFYVDLIKRVAVSNALKKFNGQQFSCNFYWEGASAWRKTLPQ